MSRFGHCWSFARRQHGLTRNFTTGRQFNATTNPTLVPFLLAGVTATCAVYLFWPNESRSAPTYGAKPLNPTYFTPATITASETSSTDTKILTLAVPPELLPKDSIEAPIWSVYIKDDDIQVERPYTPLEGVDDNGHMRFWIKKYEKGEVGKWLHSKTVGDTIEIRGPMQTRPWKPHEWDEVVMISGGTGITPFYQLLHKTFSVTGSRLKTRFTLLHSSRTPSELPPSDILGPLLRYAKESPSCFSLGLFVDAFSEAKSPEYITQKINIGRIDRNAVQNMIQPEEDLPWWQSIFFEKRTSTVSPKRKILFLVCGPESMINAIAGPYGRNFSQGKVGGILEEMGCNSYQVWKM
ncbi:hypothetical protein BJ138DRAFT_1140264 [Hygrophoropsis aurantiaca]|uniref:Uncharacterized protein n=1 Tax=Hygrophoropsis aurantiaca TaxID=72124 RepID=A0ACB8ASD5_9AGAM|nr:hypothetical protein BJ138DRAFT_1140264 [Hygrophoropsis aurantiaca]